MSGLLAALTADEIKAWVTIIGVTLAVGGTIGVIAEFYWTRKRVWREGKTLVGVLVQANNVLFADPPQDAPAMMLISFKTPSGTGLDDIAERLAALKQGKARNGVERSVARLVRNEWYIPWRRSLLPTEFTGGKEVYSVGVMIELALLPERRLSSHTFVLKAVPGAWGRVFLAPEQKLPSRTRKRTADPA